MFSPSSLGKTRLIGPLGKVQSETTTLWKQHALHMLYLIFWKRQKMWKRSKFRMFLEAFNQHFSLLHVHSVQWSRFGTKKEINSIFSKKIFARTWLVGWQDYLRASPKSTSLRVKSFLREIYSFLKTFLWYLQQLWTCFHKECSPVWCQDGRCSLSANTPQLDGKRG